MKARSPWRIKGGCERVEEEAMHVKQTRGEELMVVRMEVKGRRLGRRDGAEERGENNIRNGELGREEKGRDK